MNPNEYSETSFSKANYKKIQEVEQVLANLNVALSSIDFSEITDAIDSKKAWIEAALEDNTPIAEPVTEAEITEYSAQFKLRIPRSLHRSLAEHAKAEGTSMNQYCLYLFSSNDALRVPN